jgi:hypothetical protein
LSGFLGRKFINFGGTSSDEKYVPTKTAFRGPNHKLGLLRLLSHGLLDIRQILFENKMEMAWSAPIGPAKSFLQRMTESLFQSQSRNKTIALSDSRLPRGKSEGRTETAKCLR